LEVYLLFVAWIIFHVIVCVALVLVVLMQSSKGEGLAGSAFSGGISGAVFGGRGAASFLSRATTYLAIAFMFNCGGLAWMSAQGRSTVSQQGTTQSSTTESAVTRQAQAEMQRQQQQQQQNQQGLPGGTGTTTPPASGEPQTTPPAGGTGK
jgi:preprotein translocase subunit SecG